jgi:hypothetical protein
MTSFPTVLRELTALESLTVHHPQTEGAAKTAAGLTNLAELTVTHPLLTSPDDLSWIGKLPHLRRVTIITPQLQQLPDVFGSLQELAVLSLETPALEILPPTLEGLPHLTSISIASCALTRLPEWFARLDHLHFRSLKDLVDPPPEVVEQGMEAVQAFMRARAAEPEHQWSSKLLVVGEATVGKTSLAKQLTGGEYDPDEGQTHGVHIDPLALAHPAEPEVTMNLKVWDFGGQLEYRATQRFYLTDRSLFLLAWNSRARWRDGKVTAWLDVIHSRAPKSPVLVVATHADQSSAATLPDNLAERYPQIVGSHAIDSATGTGIDALHAAIRNSAASLPLMGVAWPRSWVAAADAVRALPGYSATVRTVWRAMEHAGVDDPQAQQVIARALHDLGDVVFFADDRDLAQKMILHPGWLDKRITDVLDSPAVAAARGVLTRAERDRMWGDLDDPDLSERLIRMMERFDLAYRVGDADSSDEVALVVERLGDTRPQQVEERWQDAGQPPDVREIGIAYRLHSRQAGIPTWFIAREHRYTTGLHWMHGALLHDRDPEIPAWALLVDDEREQPTVTLRVRGRFPVRFLSVLAEAFEDILERRYPGLIEQRLVPCACSETPAARCGHLFPLDELVLEALDTDPGADRKMRCPRSRIKVDARAMLDGLRGSVLEAKIDGMRAVLDEQADTLTMIDRHTLATLNGLRTLMAHRATAGVHCPSLFEVEDLGRSGALRRRSYELRLWCEWPYEPHGPHPLAKGVGVYRIDQLPMWLRGYLPYLVDLIGALGIVVPLAGSALTAAGVELSERAKASLETAGKLLEAIDSLHGSEEGEPGIVSDGQLLHAAGLGPRQHAFLSADFRALTAALNRLDPDQVWGGLSPVERPEDRRIVYLCRRHARALEYPYRSHTDDD